MERPVPLARGTRPRARHCYEGFVNKRGPRDQGYQGVWAGLRGLKLAFYRFPQDQEPLEVLDLGELETVQVAGGALVLKLKGQQVTMKTESSETQEMWRGFILTMAKMRLPRDLALLPGHQVQLLEALREERERRATPVSPGTALATPVSPGTALATPVSPGTPVSPSSCEPVPRCFFQVTRAEAERLLEQSAERGNLLLRPGGHGQGLSVTTRQEQLNGVKKEAQGYVIDTETPHRCSSLADVVQFFVRRSAGSLQPLEPEYSAHLEFVPKEAPPAPNEAPPAPKELLLAPSPPPQFAAAPSPAPRRGRPLSMGLVPEEQLYMNDPGSTHELLRELHWKLRLRHAPLRN